MSSILSVDYGLKRIGLAVTDPNRTFAFPHGIVENKNFDFVLSHLKEIIAEKEIDLIIVGVPYNMRDKSSDNKMAKIVKEFISKLKEVTKVPVLAVDERLSSFMAEENLKECNLSTKKSKKFIDAEAARLLLQEFIEKNKNY